MKVTMFAKQTKRLSQKLSKPWFQSSLLKYIIQKQQIQLMRSADDDNGLNIFPKLKHLFFADNEDDEEISSLISSDPLKSVDKILLILTQYYCQKLQEEKEPLEEEIMHITNKLRVVEERMQNLQEDNEHFKKMIDKLEEEKKDIEANLNQTQDQISRSQIQFDMIAGEKEKIKYEANQFYQNYQHSLAEISQLKQIVTNHQKEILRIRDKNKKLNDQNQSFAFINKTTEENLINLVQENRKLREDNDILTQKITQKEEFIASFISQYNKMHFFQHHDSFNETEGQLASNISKEEDSNELKQFNFNQFDKDSIISQKSSGKQSSKSKSILEPQVDQKFVYVNATAEKLRPPIPPIKISGSEQKQYSKQYSSGKSKKIMFSNKNSVARQNEYVRKDESKGLIKTLSSKNLRNKESLVTPSDAEGSKVNIEEALRKKLIQKNTKLTRLQSEIYSLRSRYIEQREDITEMEGHYQIQLQQMKEQIKYLKTQLYNVYHKYTLANSQSLIYQQKVVELEKTLQEIEEKNTHYCDQLKRRCKIYIIKKLDEAEEHYINIKTISDFWQSSQQRTEQNGQNVETNQFYIEQAIQEEQHQSLSLHFHQDRQSQTPQKQCHQSDAYSYEHVEHHVMDGLTLDLDFSMTNKNVDCNMNEIYFRQTFQIQSDLGDFTERLMSQPKQVFYKRGSLTDRVGPKMLKSMMDIKNCRKNYKINSQVVSTRIEPNAKIFTLENQIGIMCLPKKTIMKIEREVSELFIPKLKKLNYFKSQVVNYLPITKTNNLVSRVIELQLSSNSSVTKCICQLAFVSLREKQLNNFNKNQIYLPLCLQKSENSIQNIQFLSISEQMNLKSNIISPRFQQKYQQTQKTTNNDHPKLLIQHQIYEFSQKRERILNITRAQSVCVYQKNNVDRNLSKNIVSELQYISIKKQSLAKLKIMSHINDYSQTMKRILSITTLQSICLNQTQKLVQKQISVQTERYDNQLHLFVDKKSRDCIQIDQNSSYELNNTAKFNHFRYNSASLQQNCHKLTFRSINQSQDDKTNQEEQCQTKLSTRQTTSNSMIGINQIQKQKKIHRSQLHSQLLKNNKELAQKKQYLQSNYNGSPLNKACIMSPLTYQAESDKSDSSYNPQSKLNRLNNGNPSEIQINPWFIDDKKYLIYNNQLIKIQNLPQELLKQLSLQKWIKLNKFLKEQKLTLKFEDFTNENNFKKPRNIKRKLYLFKVVKNQIEKTMLLGGKLLYCLQDRTKLVLDKPQYVNSCNFMFGQSEVTVSSDRNLTIYRKNKIDIMKGNIPDGQWPIQYYLTFQYKVNKNTPKNL